MSCPFLSIIIPVYNVRDYIIRCVQSLIKQSYNQYEIILVDDGSTDDSGSICDKLSQEHEKIMCLHKSNGGLASARNYGLEYATGDYVVFIDSDDWVSEDYFDVIIPHLKENRPDILKYGLQRINNGVIGGASIPYYDEGVYTEVSLKENILPGAIGPVVLFDYSKDPVLSACTCALSRQFIIEKDISFKSEKEILNEDYLFCLTCLIAANTVEILHNTIYIYDYREGSLSKRYVENMVERKEKLAKAFKELLIKEKIYDKFKNQYYANCIDGYYACIVNECSKWNTTGNKNKQIQKILNRPGCVTAIKNYKKTSIKLRGKIIVFLMRVKASSTICILYMMVKR